MEIKVRDIGSMPEKSVSELEEEVINSVSNENDENITKDDDSDGSESSSTVVENEGESEGLIKMSEADVLSFFEDKLSLIHI